MLTIFLTLVVAICWSLPYFLIKDISNYISNTEIIVLSHFIWHVFILSFAIFIWIFKRNKATNFIESDSWETHLQVDFCLPSSSASLCLPRLFL